LENSITHKISTVYLAKVMAIHDYFQAFLKFCIPNFIKFQNFEDETFGEQIWFFGVGVENLRRRLSFGKIIIFLYNYSV
jgi:hypothetical protein